MVTIQHGSNEHSDKDSRAVVAGDGSLLQKVLSRDCCYSKGSFTRTWTTNIRTPVIALDYMRSSPRNRTLQPKCNPQVHCRCEN